MRSGTTCTIRGGPNLRLGNGTAASGRGDGFSAAGHRFSGSGSLENFWAHLLFASWNNFPLSEDMIFWVTGMFGNTSLLSKTGNSVGLSY